MKQVQFFEEDKRLLQESCSLWEASLPAALHMEIGLRNQCAGQLRTKALAFRRRLGCREMNHRHLPLLTASGHFSQSTVDQEPVVLTTEDQKL